MGRQNSMDFENEFSDNDFSSEDSGSLVDQIDLQHYLRILRKYKWPVTLFTAIVTALAAYYAYTATPIYRSSSRLLIDLQQNGPVAGWDEIFGAERATGDYYQTQYELIRSLEVAKRVVDDLNLKEHPYYAPAVAQSELTEVEETGQQTQVVVTESSPADVSEEGEAQQPSGILAQISGFLSSFLAPAGNESNSLVTDIPDEYRLDADPWQPEAEDEDPLRRSIASRLLGGLSVEPVRRTKLVIVSYESPDPELAAAIANSFPEQYLENYLDKQHERKVKAQSWWSERLGELKSDVEEAEQRLLAYKQANGLIDVDGSVGRLNEQELMLLTNELADAKSKLSDAADLRKEVRSLRATSPQLLETLPGVQDDPLVRSVKLEQGIAQRELDELSNRYGAKHPKIVDVRSRLDSLNNNLQKHIDRVVNSIESDYQLLRQRVGSVQAKLASGKQEIQAIGSKKIELEALEREVDKRRDVYNTFFATQAEADSVDGLEKSIGRLEQPATPSYFPVKPRKQQIIALAALASLILSVLMAFLYEQMDDTIKGTGDIEDKLGIKLLGIMPLIKGGLLGTKRKLPLNPEEIEDKKGTFFEAVNTARTALTLHDDENRKKVILVTSSIPGEGKSTTSVNLAYSLSQMEKVLLIDCDMRKPTIAKTLKLDRNTPGLSSLIMRTAEPRQCIHRSAIGDMDVIPSGPIPDQPLELLSSKRFEKLVEQLSQHYDRIVIDSAPVQAVSDALVLSRLADTVVYAIKSHSTSIDLVKRGIQRLRQSQAPIGGAIITQVDVDKIVSYGGDYYYQGYYDYYGYNTKGERSRKGGRKKLTPEEINAIRTDDSDYDYDFGLGAPAGNGLARAAAGVGESQSRSVIPDSNEYAVNGQNTNGNGHSRPQRQEGYADDLSEMEFDLTTRLESNRGRQRKTLRDRMEDDLDLI